MDTSKLKPFAQEARRTLRAQVSARLDLVLAEQSAARREQPKAVAELESEIARTDRDQVVERVAYTWFNRFTALRFMDANGYTRLKVVSPAEGQTRPEILAEAAAGNIDDDAPAAVRETVAALMDGRMPSADAQGESYRLLLVAACNQWHAIMPFMFEKIADYTELLLPEDLLSAESLLGKVRTVMTEDACQDVEIIGWLYQFYISEKKDEVFAGLKKNKKITAENIPAATQLFTPHWIVRYLVENSLGRLWLLNRPTSQLAAKMEYYIAPEVPETDFLRISRPEDIRICDPACGSGHMLTYAFDLLYAIYEEEGYDANDIPGLILTNNLHGIEIDDRAGALAAFALAMKSATKLGRRRFLRQAAQPNICVLQDVRFTPSEMQDVAAVVGTDLFTTDFSEMMGQFEQAKNFGSLIVPKLRDPAEVAQIVRLKDFGGDLLLREVQQRVLLALEMAEALSPKYHVVVANPPYAGARGLNGALSAFAASEFPNSKSDLMTCFMERSRLAVIPGGYWGMINLPSWMFLSSYQKLRENIIHQQCITNLLHLGRGIFGSDFGSVAFVIHRSPPNEKTCGIYRRLFEKHVQVRSVEKIESLFKDREYGRYVTAQTDLTKIPGSPLVYWVSEKTFEIFADGKALGEAGDVKRGMTTSDNNQFLRYWPEVSEKRAARNCMDHKDAKESGAKWFPYSKGGGYRKWYGFLEFYINWENDGRDVIDFAKTINKSYTRTIVNIPYYFKPSVGFSYITSGPFSVRMIPSGCLYDSGGPGVFAEEGERLAILACMNSTPAIFLLGLLNPTVNLQIADVVRLPLPLFGGNPMKGLDGRVAATLIRTAKSDWDAYETSWDFVSLPLLSDAHRSETVEASYSALRAHWQVMTDEMQKLEEENNRLFIDAYGLQDELSPEVPLEEITLTCNPAYSLKGDKTDEECEDDLRTRTLEEFLHYAVGCMFGRYSLDAPGLILANPGEGLAEYLARVPNPTFEPDADNVIPVLDGDWFADDIAARFRKFLRVTFGEVKFQENLAFIEGALGKDIRKWFTRDFYEYHVRRYKKRPIYWMFASPKGSFQALIYMHRYQSDTVSVVLNDYLREYRNKLEAHRKAQEALSISTEASPAQRSKALKEIGEVSKVIDELDGYERDVLFPLATQRIEIDLDDGVKANYPKFGAALKPIKGLGDADD